MNNGILPWVLGVCAALIVGLAKTGVPGIGAMAAALMVTVFPAKESVGALLPMLIVGDIFALIYYRRQVQWKRLLELFPSVVAGMVLGAFVLARLANHQLKPILGGLILVLLLLELLRRQFGWTNMPRRPWFVIVMGALAGFATTVGNVSGPIMNIYLISRGLRKERFMGTVAWYYFIVNCSKVPLYLYLGMINHGTLRFDLMMVPGIIAGALVGRWVLGRMGADLFKSMVLILSALAAAWLLF